MRQIFLDTETTGLNADQGDRIIEVGCVELVNRRLTGKSLHFYVNPERDSHEDALRIHGITTEFLRDKPRFEAVADALLDFVADAEVIIHNAAFDLGFLNKELELLKKPPFKDHVRSVVDSLVMAKERYPGKRNSLDALCDRLEVDRSGRTFHGALLDAELLADVYINLTRGQNSLLMDVVDDSEDGFAPDAIDLRRFDLPVLQANPQEYSAHEDVLVQIDKASGGKTVWRKVTSSIV
jgi:DNA polymerase-3 subunit epsilon